MIKTTGWSWSQWGRWLGLWALAALLQAWPWHWGDQVLMMPWLLAVTLYGFDRQWPGMVGVMWFSVLLLDAAYQWPMGQTALVWVPLCWGYAFFREHHKSASLTQRMWVLLGALIIHQGVATMYWQFPGIIPQYSWAILPPWMVVLWVMRGDLKSCQKKY